MLEWFSITTQEVIGIILSSALIYMALMILTKINGLRTFSKMSGHDFAITVAIGSIVASSVISKTPSVAQAALAIATLLILQSILSFWRIKRIKNYFENTPLLLMDGNIILKKNLEIAKVTENDLMAKLREANVLNFEEVRAVVLEQTGDISVLHGNKEVQDKILHGVERT